MRYDQSARIAFQGLTQVPWIVALAVPLAELQSAWRTPLVTFGLVGALLGLLALGMAVLVGQRIARPVTHLAALAPSSRGVALVHSGDAAASRGPQ